VRVFRFESVSALMPVPTMCNF